MRVLENNRWRDGYLDYHASHADLILDVHVWIVLEPVTDQFVEWKVSGSNMGRVLSYIRAIGFRHAFIKIMSRWRERGRNQKFLSLGIGRRRVGDITEEYLFLAVNHPECVDRISVDKNFCMPWKFTSSLTFSERDIQLYKPKTLAVTAVLRKYKAWSPLSGFPLDRAQLRRDLEKAMTEVGAWISESTPHRFLSMSPSLRRESSSTCDRDRKSDSCLSATLFGLGNYAKTVVMPALKHAVRVERIHEMDPLQLGRDWPKRFACDTSPMARSDDQGKSSQIYLICGYHHTHVDLALQAFDKKAVAVIEKPLATNRQDFERFKKAQRESQGRFFLCFQRRYTSWNNYIFDDLGRDRPLDYRCIVHEIPLPERHWYNWPHSGTRLISNGCHWLDHFLFLNGYERANAIDVSEEDANYRVWIRLNNAAQFTMLLTNTGSSRLGVREYIEVARPGATLRILDGQKLESENDHRFIRRVHAKSKYQNLWEMYREIGKQVLAGAPGDESKTLYSSELILDLEDLLSEKMRRSLPKTVASESSLQL